MGSSIILDKTVTVGNFPESERILSEIPHNLFEPITVIITDNTGKNDVDRDTVAVALQNHRIEGVPFRVIGKDSDETWDHFIQKNYVKKASISIAIGNCVFEGLSVLEPPFYVDTTVPWSLTEIRQGSFGLLSRCFVSLKVESLSETNTSILAFLADKVSVFQIGSGLLIAVLEADEITDSSSKKNKRYYLCDHDLLLVTLRFHIGYPHEISRDRKSYGSRGDDLNSSLFPVIDSTTLKELFSRIKKYQKKSEQTDKLESLLRQKERILTLFGCTEAADE